ncbi:MAG TPA: PQQ-binding-like beta-propeller repeat protein [Herpetosiphonaceae bacterium]|nr:PQQ-binding-like beta-propeller repeat protein [Herpetosiphonaceae bacterium]
MLWKARQRPVSWIASLNSYALIMSADLGAYAGTLRAISLDRGAERWSFAPAYSANLPPRLTSPPLTVGLVYLATGYDAPIGPGRLFARDAATGAERWTRTFPGDLYNPTPPVVGGGLLYLPAAAASWPQDKDAQAPLFAVDAATGADRWAWYGGSYLRGAAVAADRLCVVAGNGFDAPQGFVAALAPRTGQELDRTNLNAIPRSGPTIADGVLYLFGDSGALAIK